MDIVILDGYTENPGDLSWAGFEKLGRLKVYERTPQDDRAEIVRRIGGAEVVITNKTPLDRQVIEACPAIRYIGVLATGYNVVDTDAARERGIPVTNIPDYGTMAVAQFTIALLLEVCHHIGHHSDAVHAGRWERNADFTFWDYPLIELAGKTLGIIGFGRIGQMTAQVARALGMQILAFDAHESGAGRALATYVPLDTLLSQSNVVSLHCPLTPQTQGIINTQTIAQMKDGAILINTARGPLVEEADLAKALNSGKLAAAAVDVVSREPITGDNPLLRAKNCIITPHIAWASKESRSRLMDIAVENLAGFLQGNASNVVNGTK